MLFSPCIELMRRISWDTLPFEFGGTVVFVAGNNSNFKNFGTAACYILNINTNK